MDKVHALLQTVMHYQIFSIQVWVYLVLMVAPFVLNEIVSRSNSVVAKTLFQFAMRALLQIPAVGVALSAIPGLGTALHKMANDTTGLPPTFAQRRAARKARKAAAPPAASPPAASPPVAPTVAILLIGLMGLTGCKLPPPCTAATANEARCKAQNVATDCAAPEVIKIVVEIMGSVSAALASNDYSKLLDAIVADVTKAGRADDLGVVLCAINKVGGLPMATEKPSVSVVHANAYKAAHPVKAVK